MARRPQKGSRNDHDSPWKHVLVGFLEQFFLLFFPKAHARIDWSRKPTFLDKELTKLVREAEVGKRVADLLVRLRTHDGEDAYVFVHIEVQGTRQEDFDHRMYVYNYRIHDRYGSRVASFAVLTDQDASWRPGVFRSEALGTEVRLTYGVAKLADLGPVALDTDPNPVALVARAHLASLETAGKREARLEAKIALVRSMWKRGYNQKTIKELLRFVDWLVELPEDLEPRFTRELKKIEGSGIMKYVTSFERCGIKKGIEKGLKKGREEGRVEGRVEERRDLLLRIVRKRFGARVASKTQGLLGGIEDLEAIVDWAIEAEDGRSFVKKLDLHAAGK